MSFWSNVAERFRRIFGRRGVPPPLPPPIPPIKKKRYLNTVFGHLVYTPVQKAGGFMIPRYNTLESFLEWSNLQGIEMKEKTAKGGTHPLALEMMCMIVLDYEITTKSPAFRKIKEALEDAVLNTYPELPEGVIPFMQWGVEAPELRDENQDEIYAEKRISRDGEDFQSYDITTFIERKLRGLS